MEIESTKKRLINVINDYKTKKNLKKKKFLPGADIPEANTPYGGSILMSALKDLSQIEMNDSKYQNLNQIFEFEDTYLIENTSDFLFGIYQIKN